MNLNPNGPARVSAAHLIQEIAAIEHWPVLGERLIRLRVAMTALQSRVSELVGGARSAAVAAGISEDKDSLCPSLPWKYRLYGFIGCVGLGIFLNFLGWLCLLPIIGPDLVLFLVLCTLGNLTSFGSSMFLMGPLNQLKRMFQKTRIIATILVFVFMILTIVFAIALDNKDRTAQVILVAASYVGQWIALIWYCLSYIPFARSVETSEVCAFIMWPMNKSLQDGNLQLHQRGCYECRLRSFNSVVFHIILPSGYAFLRQ